MTPRREIRRIDEADEQGQGTQNIAAMLYVSMSKLTRAELLAGQS